MLWPLYMYLQLGDYRVCLKKKKLQLQVFHWQLKVAKPTNIQLSHITLQNQQTEYHFASTF